MIGRSLISLWRSVARKSVKKLKISECYISLGSNIGNSYEYIKEAVFYLRSNNFIYVSACSNFYKTKAVNYNLQPDFLNVTIKLFTFLSLKQLVNIFQYIENKYNKFHNNNVRYYIRELDIDVLLYNKSCVNYDIKIIVPHLRMFRRKFVKKMLSEFFDY